MKRFAMALALMCVLSTSIFAGEIPTGGKSEPTPPGNMPTTGAAGNGTNNAPNGTVFPENLVITVILTIISLK